MAKSKSSASSATRKKYAKKAAAASGQFEEPTIPKEKKAKGKEKKSKEPRKVYIPPVKPTPVQPDPLDTLGLAQTLPPELLVVLRRLAKKDSITKRRALEELQIAWVDKARNEGADSPLLTVLADTLPVWVRPVSVYSMNRFLIFNSSITSRNCSCTHPAASGCSPSAFTLHYYACLRCGTSCSPTSARSPQRTTRSISLAYGVW